jgi:hypothetical protein
MEATEVVRCHGHPLVSASHPTTFEVTAEMTLTETGHCIIGIKADKGARGLLPQFRDVLCHDDAELETTLGCGGITAVVHARGSSAMTLDHPTDLVWRKSRYVCGRTIGICSDHVAATLPEELVEILRTGQPLVVTMVVRRPGSGL